MIMDIENDDMLNNYDRANQEWEEAKNWAIMEEEKVLSRLKKHRIRERQSVMNNYKTGEK